MRNCDARQYSDMMQCARCGLAWDVGDRDRPDCKPTKTVKPLTNKQQVMNLRNKLACNNK